MESHVADCVRDLQYAFRSLAKDRRFALIAVLALALGIGATTVMFSLVYNAVFNPFPYRDVQRSVIFEMWDLTDARAYEAPLHSTIPECLAIHQHNHYHE